MATPTAAAQGETGIASRRVKWAARFSHGRWSWISDKRVILNMAAQAETTVNMFHSPHRDMALQPVERFRGAETLPRNNNLALQAFASFESLFGDAIESFAAEIFRDAFNQLAFSPQQTHRPMQWYPFAFAAITH
jgi:hypothetical protein